MGGEGGDGGAEGPGAGGVVGDVEQEVGGEEFEAAGPGGGGDAGLDGLDQVRGSRFAVRGRCEGRGVGGENFYRGGDGESEVAALVLAGEGGTDVEGLGSEVEIVVVGGEGGGFRKTNAGVSPLRAARFGRDDAI